MVKIELVDYPGYYAREDGTIENSKGKVFNAFIDNVGYYQVVLRKNKKRCYVRVHRLIAKAFVPNVEGKKQVDHIDGNKLKNVPMNLQWVNNSENTSRGYALQAYLATTHVPITAKSRSTGVEQTFYSIRACSEALNINRKTLSSILKTGKSNNYDYDFTIGI